MQARKLHAALVIVLSLAAVSACSEPTAPPEPGAETQVEPGLGATTTSPGTLDPSALTPETATSGTVSPGAGSVGTSVPATAEGTALGTASESVEQIIARRATELLADEIAVPAHEIDVIGMFPNLWNDGSLGCAQPGQNYIQQITPGYIITLKAEGVTYEVHSDDRANGALVRCGMMNG